MLEHGTGTGTGTKFEMGILRVVLVIPVKNGFSNLNKVQIGQDQ